MRGSIYLILLLTSALSALSTASNPFPLPDGFPIPNNASALRDIERPAGGLLPQSRPTSISNSTLDSIRLIALTELFTLAFVDVLWNNITANMPGYELSTVFGQKSYTILSIEHFVAQEEIYALWANDLLRNFGMDVIPTTCNYTFPVETFQEAVVFAQTIIDLSVSTYIDLQRAASEAQDHEIVTLLGSMLGAKSQQATFFRFLQDKFPTGQSFFTVTAPTYLFNTISSYIASNSCPILDSFAYPKLPQLQILQGPTGPCEPGYLLVVPNGTCDLSILLGWQPDSSVSTPAQGIKLAYMNGLAEVVYENVTIVNHTAEMVTAKVPFPVNRTEAYGLTVLALTHGECSSTDLDEIANATVYGPGLLEYEYMYGD